MSDPVKLYRFVDPFPFVPRDPKTLDVRCRDISNIMAHGLARRLRYVAAVLGRTTIDVSIGLSGGLDSTSALEGTIDAFRINGWDSKRIKARNMPGFGSTRKTISIAERLAAYHKVDYASIDISQAVINHLRDINAWCTQQSTDRMPCQECLTCENAQARERTQILMNLGFVIGTGDMSEIAVSCCTYVGDQMSMYNIQPGMPKTLVKHHVSWRARMAEMAGRKEYAAILRDAVEIKYSPELTKSGFATEDRFGPYELHDFTMFNFVRNGYPVRKIFELQRIAAQVPSNECGYSRSYADEELARWMDFFFRKFGNESQFKRNAAPDGSQFGSVALSKTGAFRGPVEADLRPWTKFLRDSYNLVV